MTREREFLVRCVYAATQVTLRLLAQNEADAEQQARFRQKGAVYYSATETARYLTRSPWAVRKSA